ncbi:Relaxin receptor 1, partial [Stylophora pistillata]
MEELEELWLQGNNITELPPELFQDLENLQELDLSNNELGNLPPHIFRNITAVEFLKLDYNKIERLHEDQFQGLVKLFEFRRLGAHGTVREIQARAQSAQAKRERALAKRVFFIILTDFLCWIPIIAIGIKSHVEKTFDPPGDLAVWIAVFALPINSAINPLLYTLSTPQVQAILKPKLGRLWSNLQSIFCRGQNQEVQEGKSKLALGKPTSEACKPEEEVASEDIPGPSDK